MPRSESRNAVGGFRGSRGHLDAEDGNGASSAEKVLCRSDREPNAFQWNGPSGLFLPHLVTLQGAHSSIQGHEAPRTHHLLSSQLHLLGPCTPFSSVDLSLLPTVYSVASKTTVCPVSSLSPPETGEPGQGPPLPLTPDPVQP